MKELLKDRWEKEKEIFQQTKDKKNIMDFLNVVKELKIEIEKIEKQANQFLAQTQASPITTAGLKSFVSAVRSSPVNILTLKDKGWNLIVEGKYREALQVLKRAKKLAPDDIKVYILLGWVYIYLGRFDEAMAVYQKALKIEPDNEIAKANLGYISYKLGIYGEAIEKLSHIIKDGKNKQAKLYAHLYLGIVYYEREMYKDAVEFLSKAIRMGPNLYEAYYYLGIVLKRMKRKDMAIAIWNRLLKKNPENIWAKKVKEEMND